MKKIIDVMNKNLVAVEPETPFEQILSIMKNDGIGKLPVVEDGKLLGIIERDDVLVKQENAPIPPILAIWDLMITLPMNKEYQEKYRKVIAVKASELMNNKFHTISIDADLKDAVTEMLEKKKNYLLVEDNNKLVGIITKTDLIKNIF